MSSHYASLLCVWRQSRAQSSASPSPPGPLNWETAKFADAIPHDYGPLIGLTQNPQTPGWVGLWFQRSDGTIAAVFVNPQEGRIAEKTLTIPRK